jgi:hypothetical protein
LDDFSQVRPLVHRVVGQSGAPVLAQGLAVVFVVEELKENYVKNKIMRRKIESI